MYSQNYYKLYKEARDAAWQTLIDCNITSLPVDLHSIIKYLNYSVHTYSNSSLTQLLKKDVLNGDGFILQIDEIKHIYLNDKINNYGRRRFTLAHEIGHGVLNHPLEKIHFRHPEEDNPANQQEFQANIYARDILAPACVLKELQLNTAEDIMKTCLISRKSADIRKKRIDTLTERNQFYTSNLEIQVIKNFKDYINKHKNK